MDIRARTFLTILCMALFVALATATHGVAAQVDDPLVRFAPSSAFQPAERTQATGLYVLGTTSIRSWTATHYVLMRDGLSVQIHTKANGHWLDKLPMSRGGLTIGSARFDELLAIAGGLNRNTKELPQATRDRFYCRAGFGSCGVAGASTGSGETTAIRRVLGSIVNQAHAADPACPKCRRYFERLDGAHPFELEFDAGQRRIVFTGFDIRAVWSTPPLDEI